MGVSLIINSYETNHFHLAHPILMRQNEPFFWLSSRYTCNCLYDYETTSNMGCWKSLLGTHYLCTCVKGRVKKVINSKLYITQLLSLAINRKKNNLTVFYKSSCFGVFFCFVIAIFFIHLSYFCCCCCFSLLGDLICFVVAVKRYIHNHIKSISIERHTRQQTEKPHYLQCFFTWQTGNRKHFFNWFSFPFEFVYEGKLALKKINFLFVMTV